MSHQVGPLLALLAVACGGSEFSSTKDEARGAAGESGAPGTGGEQARGGSDSGGGDSAAGEMNAGGGGSSGAGDESGGGTAGMPQIGGSAGSAAGSGAAGSGGGVVTGDIATHCQSRLTGRLRDFQPPYMDQPGHPDFEPQFTKAPGNEAAYITANFNQFDLGIVASALGDDRKPRYAAPSSGTPTTNGESYFNQWFRDTPGTNIGIDFAIEFGPPQPGGIYTFESSPFLPISDGDCPVSPQTPCLMGNSRNYPTQNYAMTLELHISFRHNPADSFIFTGDDDAWIFVNGQLVTDQGGIHAPFRGAASFPGLALGEVYRLDFFWAERHVTQSNFKIETNLEIAGCGSTN